MMFELAPYVRPVEYGESIVSLDEMKAHLAIAYDEDEFDDLVAVLRDAAVDMVERYCEVRLAPCEGIEFRAECMPARLRLPVSPATAIEAMEYLDGSGATVAVDVETLRLGLKGEVLAVAGESLPSDVSGGLSVTFTAGYTDETRPPALVQAVRYFCAHLFANREAVITGTISGEIPLGFKACCAPFVPIVI